MKSWTALDNGQEPHHLSFLRPAHDDDWQSPNMVVQRSQNQGLGGFLLLCHFQAMHMTWSPFPHLSKGIKNNTRRVMMKDR